MGQSIRFWSAKKKPFGVFSNFALVPVSIDGIEYPTSEAAYQAAKFHDPSLRDRIRRAPTPKIAAHIGRDPDNSLREDWEEVKVKVMTEIVLAKFSQHSDLKWLLLSTGDERIIEDSPKDAFWGRGPDGKGKNMLGRILMSIRTVLRRQDRAQGLLRITDIMGDCERCRLCEERSRIVFGDGDPLAKIMLVGEGPGENEDKQGIPFVGWAGGILNALLGEVDINRSATYIANVVKCRPPGNRDPRRDEITTCTPFLMAQILVVKPKVLIGLGRFASNFLAGTDLSMGDLQSRIWNHEHPKLGKIPVIPIAHPSYIGRCQRKANEDPYWEAVDRLRLARDIAAGKEEVQPTASTIDLFGGV